MAATPETKRLLTTFIRRRSIYIAGAFVAVGIVAASAFLSVAPAHAQNSCFNAQNCTSTSSEWSAREQGRLNIRVRNNCSQGVSVRLCGLRHGQGELCLFEWIRGGGNWSTYIYNSTGSIAWREVGAARSTDAWSCTSGVRNWNGPMRYR